MKSVDKVIQILREMMVANAPGTGGGFSTKSPAGGPVAGKDEMMRNKKLYAIVFIREVHFNGFRFE